MDPVTTREALVRLLPDNGRMIELGTAEGRFALQIAQARPDLTLFCVDSWAGDGVLGPVHDKKEADKTRRRLEPYPNVHIFQSYFCYFAKCIPDEYFDCIYCDGYAHAGNRDGQTFHEWWPKLKPGGVFAAHDYCNEWSTNKKAIDKFASDKGITNFRVTTEPKYPTWWTVKDLKTLIHT